MSMRTVYRLNGKPQKIKTTKNHKKILKNSNAFNNFQKSKKSLLRKSSLTGGREKKLSSFLGNKNHKRKNRKHVLSSLKKMKLRSPSKPEAPTALYVQKMPFQSPLKPNLVMRTSSKQTSLELTFVPQKSTNSKSLNPLASSIESTTTTGNNAEGLGVDLSVLQALPSTNRNWPTSSSSSSSSPSLSPLITSQQLKKNLMNLQFRTFLQTLPTEKPTIFERVTNGEVNITVTNIRPSFVKVGNNSNNPTAVDDSANNSINLGVVGRKRTWLKANSSESEIESKRIALDKIKALTVFPVLSDRFIFLSKIDRANLYFCIDMSNKKRLMCKIFKEPCKKLIQAYAKLRNHPCISQLYKVIIDSNATYIFYPVSQDDLLSYVRRRKRLPERDARFLFRQMCAIVRACHHQGIVLLDLKLRKFVFSDGLKKHLKLESLIDAIVLDNPAIDLLKDKRGCPVYVAPEILKSTNAYCGKAADMWSLGVILYTMLIGRYPFCDEKHSALFAKISRGQFTLPDIISSKARCIIRCLLRQEPEERLTSEDVFYHPWMNVNDATEINLHINDQCVPNID